MTVTANGARVAEIGRGERGGVYDVGTLIGPTLVVSLETEGRSDPAGRRLGTQLYRVALVMRRRAALLSRCWRCSLSWASRAACWPSRLACARSPQPSWGSGLAGLLAAVLWPHGLVRSAYAGQLTVMLVGVGLLACAAALLAERTAAGAGRWAFAP